MNALLDRAEVFQPWQLKPYQFVNWWEMIQFSALSVFLTGVALERLSTESLICSMVVDGEMPIFNPAKPIDVQMLQRMREFFNTGERECRTIGLNITADTILEIRDELSTDSALAKNCQWVKDQISMIQQLLKKEMREKVFVYIPPEKAKFFTSKLNPYLFGKDVFIAFPSARFDVQESGCCLATARATGCAFHLMRVLETGLMAFGKKFGISLEHTNWKPALDGIESQIKKMRFDPAWKDTPDVKEKQEAYAQASSHFLIIKDAWRNFTAHARGKFTEEEAERLLDNTRSFMQKLASMGIGETDE